MSNWPELRDLYQTDWPKHILAYHLLQNYIDWHVKDSKFVDENIQISCLNGDWNDGTFFALVRYFI